MTGGCTVRRLQLSRHFALEAVQELPHVGRAFGGDPVPGVRVHPRGEVKDLLVEVAVLGPPPGTLGLSVVGRLPTVLGLVSDVGTVSACRITGRRSGPIRSSREVGAVHVVPTDAALGETAGDADRTEGVQVVRVTEQFGLEGLGLVIVRVPVDADRVRDRIDPGLVLAAATEEIPCVPGTPRGVVVDLAAGLPGTTDIVQEDGHPDSSGVGSVVTCEQAVGEGVDALDVAPVVGGAHGVREVRVCEVADLGEWRVPG